MQSSNPTLVLAAHGTVSPEGSATTAAIAAAVAAARPSVRVSLCFLDVATPSLATALSTLDDAPAVVVPLLLSSGYHVLSDIPAVVAGRSGVQVAAHLGPAPELADLLAGRLAAARALLASTSAAPVSTALVSIGSSRCRARKEVEQMAGLLSSRVGRPVAVLPLSGDVRAALAQLPGPVEVATYLIAPGTFLDGLRAAVDGLGVLTEPIGADPVLIQLVWQRYDEVVRGGSAVR